MSEKVLIPVPGLGVLALSPEDYRKALAEGANLISGPIESPAVPEEALMDAEQLAGVLALPVTWVEQKAREGVIPSIQAGRWRRFKRSAVEQALAAKGTA